jgi:excisionase family DNA binding protein
VRLDEVEFEELMTPAQVAAAFSVHPATVFRWAAEGRLESVRTPGGQRRYRAAQVREMTTLRPETSR